MSVKQTYTDTGLTKTDFTVDDTR